MPSPTAAPTTGAPVTPTAIAPEMASPVAPMAAPPVTPAPTVPQPVPAPAPPAVAITTTAPPPVATPAPGPAVPAAPLSPEGTAVKNYFAQMDALAGVNPFGDDLQGTGEKLLTSAMNGDSSGFDALIKVATDAVEKAQSITPPSACSHYHAETLAMLEESAKVLTAIKGAIARQDSGAIMAVATSAQALKSRADALTSEAAAIKKRYGIR